MPARDLQNGHDSASVNRAESGQEESAAMFGAFVRKAAGRRTAAGDSSADKPKEPANGIQPVEHLPEDAVEVGFIGDAYGLKGWVKVMAHAHGKSGGEALLAAKRWWLVKHRERRVARCLQSKVHGDSIVARLSGCDDRDAALALKGHTVHIARSDFPKLDDEDEFYWVDLIGMEVENEAGVALGRVADMIDNGAHSVLRIEYPDVAAHGKSVTGERLIPFVGVYVKTVDRAAKRIVVDWDTEY